MCVSPSSLAAAVAAAELPGLRQRANWPREAGHWPRAPRFPMRPGHALALVCLAGGLHRAVPP
jgi:hypothetical protein